MEIRLKRCKFPNVVSNMSQEPTEITFSENLDDNEDTNTGRVGFMMQSPPQPLVRRFIEQTWQQVVVTE